MNKSVLKSPLFKLGATIATIAIIASVVYAFQTPFFYNNNYKPEQPIAFDHSLHAGKYQISCMYCHAAVERSRHATVPSLNICMNCHRNVATDRPLIQRITALYNAGQSMPWVKVHMLPDFVKFNHKRHIARGVQCQTCHGPVEQMQTMYQFASLAMGWCINCHRKPENHAPISCDTCHY